jgi:uncharacterized membrane protein YfhO
MDLEAYTSEPAFLFTSEIFYPGWKAYVDGKTVETRRGNYLFRVIDLPAGNHHVSFRFEPLAIKLGVAVTLLTLFAFLGIPLFFFFRSRSSSKKFP